MHDTSHLNAIEMRLSHERVRVQEAKTAKERTWREHNVKMIERERDSEIAFLAKHGITLNNEPELSLDDIAKELGL